MNPERHSRGLRNDSTQEAPEASSPLPVYLIHYRAPDWLQSAIEAVLSSDIPVAVTVVDNSETGSWDIARLPSHVRVLKTGANVGYSGAANVALKDWLETPQGEWVIIGAHDMHPEPVALRKMLEAATQAPMFGVLGPGTTEFVTASGERARYHNGLHIGTTNGIEHRTVTSGTCLMLRRACALAVDGFDETFGSYREDDEFCLRARSLGWEIGRVPEAIVVGLGTAHEGRDELARRNDVLLALRARGRPTALKVLVVSYIGVVASVPIAAYRALRRRSAVAALRSRVRGARVGTRILWRSVLAPSTVARRGLSSRFDHSS